MLGGLGGQEYLQRVLKYDTGSDSWSEVAPMPAARGDAAVCAVDSDIYVIGGFDNDFEQCADVYRYNVVNNVWSLVSPMPGARAGHQACVLGGMIYAAGGFDADEMDLNSMLRYDPSSDTWSEVAPMSQARSDFGMFVAGSCIYAVGGEFEVEDDEGSITSRLASMEKYETESDRWSAACSMAGSRFSFQTCVLTTQDNVFDAMIRRALQ